MSYEQIHDKFDRDIGTVGWSVMGVLDPEQPFAYTVGLTGRDLPELLMTGVSPQVLHSLLNDVAQLMVARGGLQPGERLGDLLTSGADVLVTEPDQALAREHYCVQAQNHYPDRVVRVLHLVLPDAEGLLPGDEGLSPVWSETQQLKAG